MQTLQSNFVKESSGRTYITHLCKLLQSYLIKKYGSDLKISKQISRIEQNAQQQTEFLCPLISTKDANAIRVYFVFSTNHDKTSRYPNAKEQKKNLDTDLILFTNVSTKLITDLNIEFKAIKLLEDNIGENLDDLDYGLAKAFQLKHQRHA